jgi:DNA-binding PadR family transcriptional regulator
VVYTDNTLLPKEALRLAALGTLAGRMMSYEALAGEVRHFIGRIIGPSPELMGQSIELLRFEGLIAPAGDAADGAALALTGAGQAALRELMLSAVRAPSNDVDKLVLALKMRFLHLLELADRKAQLDMMVEACRGEIARLADLRAHHAHEPGCFVAWLDHDITLVRARLDWLAEFRAGL